MRGVRLNRTAERENEWGGTERSETRAPPLERYVTYLLFPQRPKTTHQKAITLNAKKKQDLVFFEYARTISSNRIGPEYPSRVDTAPPHPHQKGSPLPTNPAPEINLPRSTRTRA